MKSSVYRRRENQNWNPSKLQSTSFFYEEEKTFVDEHALEQGQINKIVSIVESESPKRSRIIINKILET